MPTKPKTPVIKPSPVLDPEPEPNAKMDAIVTLLLGLEDVLVGSSPNPESVKELYARLKEAL